MTSSAEICVSCRSPKAQSECGVCFDALCRSCALFLDEATFSFYAELPDELTHSFYCAACHQQHVEPALERYNELIETARVVFFFFETQKQRIPVLDKAKAEVKVEDCADRDETILRLGFQAAQQGFNAILDAVVSSEKIRKGAYQTTRWSGKGLPVMVDVDKLEKHLRNRW